MGSGHDTLTVTSTSTATYSIDAGLGHDSVLLRSISGTTTVNGNADNDTITVGTTNSLDPIAALLTVHGSTGVDTLIVSDSADSNANTGNLTATTIRGLGLSHGIDYFDIATLDITLGLANDTFTIQNTHNHQTNLHANQGDDAIWIQTNLGTTVVNGNAGNDLIVTQTLIAGILNVFGGTENDSLWISSNGPAANGVLALISGQLTFDGQSGDDSLIADNAGDTNPNNFLIESALLTLSGAGFATYANLEFVTVNSGSNADVITIASTHAHTTTVNSNAGHDTVHVQAVAGATFVNTAGENDTINIGSVVDGSGTLNAILALVTINSGLGSDTLNVDDSADFTNNVGDITVNTITGFGMTSGIVYAELEWVNLDMGTGNDTLTVTSTSTATYDIDASVGNDDILFGSISGTTTVTGNQGDDDFTVGTLGALELIGALLTIDGAIGNDTLTVSDAGDTNNNVGHLTTDTIRGLGMPLGINYTNVGSLNLTMGLGNDQFAVFTTHLGNTTINGNNGNDTVWVETLQGRTWVNGDMGNDVVIVGLLVDGNPLPTIDHLRQQLTVSGGTGADTLTLDDRGNPLDLVIGIDGSQVTGLTDQPVLYFEIAVLNILSGSGHDVLNVRGTTAAATNVLLADGDEQIFVSSNANATLANARSIDFQTGHLDLLTGIDLNINAGNGRHRLMISDEAATVGDGAVTISDSSAAAMASGMEIIISGLAPSNVSYGAAASANFADGISIWSGFGNDTITIDATHYRDGTDSQGYKLRTITSLMTGLGDDDVTVSLTDAEDGFFVLNTQGPYNNQPTFTDKDIVDASASTLGLIIMGGQDADHITGGQARDIIFGDRGSYLYFETPPANLDDWNAAIGLAAIVIGNGGPGDRTDGRVYEPGFGLTQDISIGGNDVIYGQGGDDYIMGQFGDDEIHGEGGEDDIIGGHNVLGAPDGDDFLTGGDAADVIIGDNGTINRRWIAATEEFERYVAPFADVIRDVELFDFIDDIGGNDTLIGDDGDDRLFGQLGDDTLDGGAGTNEMIGGRGNNHLIGGVGTDFLIGGPAKIIRAVDENGAPVLNTDGSWRRDIIFEHVGVVTEVIDISTTPEYLTDWTLAQKILAADMVLVVGIYDADGERVFIPLENGKRGPWKTHLLLIDIDAPGDDVITGDEGNDIVIGGFGNDTLSGGEGDDLIIGDTGYNLLPYMNDVPLMFSGILLRDDLTGTLELDRLGTFVVPDFDIHSVMTQTTVPQMTVIPEFAANLREMVYDDDIPQTDGTTLSVFASIIPDLRNTELQPGNDTLNGNEGNDTLIGDNLEIRSPIDTIHPSLNIMLNAVVHQLAHIQVALFHGSALLDIAETELGTSAGPQTYTIGSDTLDGGIGNDTIVGDNALWTGAVTFMWPIQEDNIVDGTLKLYTRLLDMNWAFADAEHAIRWANQQPHDSLRLAKLLIRRAEINRSQMNLSNDTILGGEGEDTIAGDDQLVAMPVVTSLDSFRERLFEIRDHRIAFRLVYARLNREIVKLTAPRRLAFAQHRIRDWVILKAPPRVSLDAAWVSFNESRGNDNIDAGDGNDLVAGDALIIGDPALNVTPENRQENNRIRGPMRRAVNLTRAIGGSISPGINYRVDLRIPPRVRQLPFGAVRTEAADTIHGGDGDDVLMGDNGDIAPYVWQDRPFDPDTHEVRSRPRLGRVYVDTHMGGDDTIDGGDGDDVLDGRVGFDTLIGGTGADTMMGGGHRDEIDADEADVWVRQGGTIRRHVLVNFTNNWLNHINEQTATQWSQMDPYTSLWARILLRR
ncbi:MAG: hypothetical protein AAF497_01435 [Planctomycetota bacterium]